MKKILCCLLIALLLALGGCFESPKKEAEQPVQKQTDEDLHKSLFKSKTLDKIKNSQPAQGADNSI